MGFLDKDACVYMSGESRSDLEIPTGVYAWFTRNQLAVFSSVTSDRRVSWGTHNLRVYRATLRTAKFHG